METSLTRQSAEQNLRTFCTKCAAWYSALPKQTVRTALLYVLLLWIVGGLVQLLWSLFPSAEVAAPNDTVVIGRAAPSSGQAARAEIAMDPAAIKQWELFGKLTGEPPEQAKPLEALSSAESQATETRLQLTLNGIIESDNERGSRAIITYQGEQAQYAIGDKLPVRGQVKLRRLLPDRVLLNNAGKIEALFLFDERQRSRTTSRSTAASRPAVQPRARQTSISQSMRQRLLDNPMSITDVVRISEARENGKLIGYKVRPSRDRSQFEQLGLQNDDIVLAVNGVSLDNTSNAMRVFQTLRKESEASFDISRGGENISLVVSLDDVQAGE